MLLAAECGGSYKIRREPGLDVSEHGIATGSAGRIQYRVEIGGRGYRCCDIHLDLLNAGSESVSVRPFAAELQAEKCAAKFVSVWFVQGSDARDFAQVDQRIDALAEKRVSEDLRDRGRRFELVPNSFLTLDYFARGQFHKECGAYSFKLPVGSAMIATTFTEPE